MRTRATVAFCLGMLILASACGDDNPVKPLEEGWYSLGLDESYVWDLELAWPYLFASTEDGLLRATVSSGEPEWRVVGFAGEHCSLVRLLKDGALLVSSRKLIDEYSSWYFHGLYRSEDIGHTWTLTDSSHGAELICLTSCCDALIGAKGDGEFYKSVDDGLSWSRLGQIGWAVRCQIACHPADCSFLLAARDSWRISELFISHDGGETWSLRTYSDLGNHSAPTGVAMDPRDKRVAYVGTHGAVLRTSDGGATWTPIIEPAEPQFFIAVVHDPFRQGHVYAGGDGHVYVTPDAGATVERIQAPVDGQITDMVCVGNQKMLFITTGRGVHKYVF